MVASRMRRATDPGRGAGYFLVAALLPVLLVCGTAPDRLAAQRWTAEARLGHLDFRLSPTEVPPVTSLALGLAFSADDHRLDLSAGVPTAEEDPLWGAVALRDRSELTRGALTLGIDGAGQAFVQRYSRSIETPGGPLQPPTVGEEAVYGWGVAAQALPFAAYEAGAIRVEGRAGASFYQNALDDRSASRTVGLGDLRVTAAATERLALTGEARHFVAEEGNWTFAGVGALAAFEGTDVWATVGHWLDEGVAGTPWSVGAATRLARRLDLLAEGREDVLDPVYGSTPRRSWSVALRVRLAEPPAPAEPVPAAYDDGTATIAIPADEAGRGPAIAGDFNGWTAEPMVRDGDRWVWRGRLEPGVYEYAFVAADGSWFVPASVPGRKDDGMGGWVALLIVEEPGS